MDFNNCMWLFLELYFNWKTSKNLIDAFTPMHVFKVKAVVTKKIKAPDYYLCSIGRKLLTKAKSSENRLNTLGNFVRNCNR